jgi:pilus assembly protein Flp/PilA
MERGQGLVEYALILVLVAVVVIAVLALLGPSLAAIMGDISCMVSHGNRLPQYRDEGYTYDVKMLWVERRDELVGTRTLVDASGETAPDDGKYCWVIAQNDTEFRVLDFIGVP